MVYTATFSRGNADSYGYEPPAFPPQTWKGRKLFFHSLVALLLLFLL